MIQLLERHPWFEVSAVAASDNSAGKNYVQATRWMLDTDIPDAVAKMTVQACKPGLECDFVLSGLPSDIEAAGGVPDPGPDSREALLLGAPAASVPDLARQASPVAHASATAPPVLLMHGAADDLVPPAQSVRLAGALRAAGATVELELVPGATHFWKGASDVPGIVRRSVGFLRAVTPGGAGR